MVSKTLFLVLLGSALVLNFQSNASYDEAIKKSEVLENQITQHFIHLHGYLQNLEQELKSELVAYRESIERNVEECENGLSNLAEKLKTACAIFTNAEKNNKKINMKKYTEKILELADSPCHFVGMTTSGEELSMDLDDSTYDNLRQHLQLKLPEIPKPRLVMTDELPEDYELEPIPEADMTNASFKGTSKKDTSSAGTSSVNQSVDVEDEEDFVFEPQPISSLVTEQATECVRITHIINPADFYVLRESDRQELEILEGMIADYTENKSPGIPDVVNLNQIYIVKYLETNKWYRGRVVRLKEAEEATGYVLYDVFYIDYGRTDVGVTIDRIRNTMPNFNYFNGMALHCNLREMGPVEDEWHDDIIDKFRQMVAKETFIMKILKSDQQVQTVELYKQKNNPNNISLHDWLVDTKKAHAITSYKLKRMNPLSTRHFYYEDLPLEKTSYVHVCHIESPLCIYIYKVKSTDVAEKLNVFNTQFDQYAVSTDRTIREPELGNAVAVRTSSNRYQRGLVSKINSQEKKAFVFLVDYGQTVTADYQAIHHLPQRFCIFNAQAIKVSILDITPADGDKWSIDCISYLKKKLEDRASIKVIPYEKVDDTYNVVMYVKDTNIGSNLVAKKFALSTGDRSKNPTLNKVVPSSKKRKKSKALKLEMNLPAPNDTSVPRRRTAEDSDPFKTRVMISKVISPDLIYASLSSNVAKFEEMNRRMQLFYETHHSEWERELHLNLTYCCYSAKDKQYCRAQFMGYNENDPALVKMLLIDMAEIEDDIPLEAVQPLTSEFFQPSQNVFKIKLAGIRPCGGTNAWTSTSCEKLKDIISDTGDSKYYVTLVGSCDEDKVFPVSLAIRRSVLTTGPLEPVRKETIIVARRLIDDGVALPIKGFFDKDKKEPAVELQKKLRLHSTENQDDSLDKKKTTAVAVSTPSSDVEVNQEIVEDKIRENEDPNKVTAEAAKDDDNDDFNDSTAIPKYADWLPPAYLRDDSFNAIITYVDNDCDVYFYPDTKEYNETRDHIANTLKEYSKKAIQKQDLTWEEGDLCIAKFHATNCWCRGKVTEVVNNQTVKVLFVDWGNVEDCSIGTLKKRIVLEEIPIQVMRASIEGLSSNGFKWETHDLDVIHRTLVVQPCQIRVIEKPPLPWKVAIWVTKGSSFVTLPWYIKNMTQVDCDTDVSKYHEIGINVPSEPTNLTTKVDDSAIKDNNTNGIVICVDDNDDGSGASSHELSKSSDDGNNEYGTPDSMMHECDESESTTLRYEEQFVDVTAQMELMQLSIINESQESDKSSSTPSLESACSNDRKMKVFSPFGEQNRMPPENNGMEFKNSFFDEEPMISGNSVLYNASSNALEFDVMSVKTEALNQHDDDHELISSTPLNASFTSVLNDDYSRKMIDFQRFNVKCFEIGLGQAFSEIHMSGYLRNSSNRDLKQWIDQCHQIHECIQSCVEEQEIFVPQSGDYCIAQYDDGMWYRARATQRTVTNDVSGTVVEFMDYGNRMSISDDENCIRTIRQEWLDVPWMGFSFKLFNVKVAPGRDKEARESINEVLGQSDRYWVQIKRYDPEIELELFSSKKNKRLVYASLIEGNIFEKIDPKL